MEERLRVRGDSPYEDQIGFSRALRVGNRVLVSGTAPVWPGGECHPDVTVQAERCVELISKALAGAGAKLSDVVRTRMYIVDSADAEAVGIVHGRAFGAASPAATMVVVAGLLDPRWKVEIEAEAVIGDVPNGT